VGIYNENRGPSDGVVFKSSALSNVGVGTLAGTALVTGANHLVLGWYPAVESQVANWLS
jgi:hypothetical protein